MASSTKATTRGVTSGPTVNWVNPGNIVSSNNVYTTASLSYGSVLTEVSDYIRADYFGFDIPEFATIDGIVCSLERKASAANVIQDYAVSILKNGSVPAGSDDKKYTLSYWPAFDATINYGSASDLWGTTWTPADINHVNTGFGVRAEYMPGYGSATAYVDYMEMTVYYTLNGIKHGATSVGRIYHGSTIIKAIYHGSTQIG